MTLKMRQRAIPRRGAALVGAVALAGVLVACGVDTPDATVTPVRSTPTNTSMSTSNASTPQPAQTTTSVSAAAPSSTSTSALLAAVTVSPQEAGQAALAVVPSGRVISIELERSSGVVVWEVDVATTDAVHEVDVDAAKGTVVTNQPDRSSSSVSQAQGRLDAATLGYDDALKVATGAVSRGEVVEIGLDESGGRLVWEADVITSGPVKHELDIDAKSGTVIKRETAHSDTHTDTHSDTHTDDH